MFAEADNEVNNGPTAEAYEEAINKVGRRAYCGKPVNTFDVLFNLRDLSKSAFLAELQEERSRELCFECLRKCDLVRWGIFVTNMKRVAADFTIGAMASTWRMRSITFDNVTNRDIRWPIPERELGLNKLLVQNEGW